MPIIDDQDERIQYVPISGPAIDALERRREENNNQPIAVGELLAKFALVRTSLLQSLRMLVREAG